MPNIITEILLLLVWLGIAIFFTLAIFGSFLIFGIDIWIKRKSRGATIVVFYDVNREESYQLIKLEGEESFTIDSKISTGQKDEVKYVIDPKKQMSRYWPPALPAFLQTKMAAYHYMAGNPTPIDPLSSLNLRILSPRMLSRLTSSAILTGLIREARESIGFGVARSRYPLFNLIGVGVLIVLVIIDILMSNSATNSVSELKRIVTQEG